MVGGVGQHREGSQAEKCDLGQKPQQPDPVGTVDCNYASWPEAGGWTFCQCQPVVGDCGSKGWGNSWHLNSLQVQGSLQQPKGSPPKRGHEPVVGQESLPRPGTQGSHWVLQWRGCITLSAPQVHSTLTVIKAGVDGLALERAEPEEESTEGGPWATLTVQVPGWKGP